MLMFTHYFLSIVSKGAVGDLNNFYNLLITVSRLDLPSLIDTYDIEIGFVLLLKIISKINISFYFFVFIIIGIIWSSLYYSINNIFKRKHTLLIFFMFYSLFFFYNFNSNIIKQGLATSFVLIAIVNLNNDNILKAIIFSLIGISFHYSALIIFVIYLIYYLKPSIKLLIGLYITSIILLLTNLNQVFLKLFTYLGNSYFLNQITFYTSDSTISSYGMVNRIDFVIFNTFWIFFSYIIYLKSAEEQQLRRYIKYYIGFSIVFSFFAFITYSDRIAIYSWFLLPILIHLTLINNKTLNKNFIIISFVISIFFYLFFKMYNIL